MRILLVTGSYPPMHCGVGDYAYRLAHAVAQTQEGRLGVLTSKAACERSEDDPIEVLPILDDWGLRHIRRVASLLQEWRPDVVHLQFPTQGYGRGQLPTVLPLLCYLMRIPIVQTWHEPRRGFGLGNLAWLVLQVLVPGVVIVVRPQFEQMMPAWLRSVFLRKALRHIPNGPALPRVSLTETEREEIRRRFGRRGASLIVYFGFMYPEKGVEHLFEIADPDEHHIVLVGEKPDGGPQEYFDGIVRAATSGRWSGRTTMPGFLATEEAARIIAAADAVVLPFRSGGGEWNTSIHSVQVQGTFILTTSKAARGYDPAVNTYYAAPGDIDDMRAALRRYAGSVNDSAERLAIETWRSIAEAHREVYRAVSARHGRLSCDSANAG